MDDNERWLLSFYRFSEISGALFFGRLTKSIPAGPIQHDMTKHFADESNHAWLWTNAISELGEKPIRIGSAYQDKYLEAAGLPVNIMEILAITNVFEARVIAQYAMHNRVENLSPIIGKTFKAIMDDEKWHLKWIGKALEDLAPKYGQAAIDAALQRYRIADKEVYGQVLDEHRGRIEHILSVKKRG